MGWIWWGGWRVWRRSPRGQARCFRGYCLLSLQYNHLLRNWHNSNRMLAKGAVASTHKVLIDQAIGPLVAPGPVGSGILCGRNRCSQTSLEVGSIGRGRG